MQHEALDFNRFRWNRTLLNGFWFLLFVSIVVECLYLTITLLPSHIFIQNYIILPSVLLFTLLLTAEICFRTLSSLHHDYLIILTSTLISFILVLIHQSVEYLLMGLYLPVILSIYYFHTRKLMFAIANTFVALLATFVLNTHSDLTIIGLCTLTVMLVFFGLVSHGIILRGGELMMHLKNSFESNQELLVKTIVMDKLAKTDTLTDLYNHITFHEYLDRLIEQHELNGLPLHLALIDIDHFKLVNDTYGHRAGDAVLQRVAELLRNRLASHEIAARYGGEEFAVLFTEQDTEEVMAVLDVLHGIIAAEKHAKLDGQTITVSIGISEYRTGEGKEPFFNRTDTALYEAKSTGRNRIVKSLPPPALNKLA